MKKIMQFRYEGTAKDSNYPPYIDYLNKLSRGNIFSDYPSVSQLGIQGPPGLKFYLNKSKDAIAIGRTGIYELDLENIGRIFAIRFDEKDLMEMIVKKDSRLLVDIVYGG